MGELTTFELKVSVQIFQNDLLVDKVLFLQRFRLLYDKCNINSRQSLVLVTTIPCRIRERPTSSNNPSRGPTWNIIRLTIFVHYSWSIPGTRATWSGSCRGHHPHTKRSKSTESTPWILSYVVPSRRSSSTRRAASISITGSRVRGWSGGYSKPRGRFHGSARRHVHGRRPRDVTGLLGVPTAHSTVRLRTALM